MLTLRNYLITLFLIFVPTAAAACTACFYGDADQPANKALRMGIIVLLVVLVIILGLFARFFLILRKRQKIT